MAIKIAELHPFRYFVETLRKRYAPNFIRSNFTHRRLDDRRSLIGMAIPEIVALLKESHGDACQAYTYTVAKLPKQGNRANMSGPLCLRQSQLNFDL